MSAVGVQWEALLGQVGVVGHQEASHITNVGAGHVVGCHGALVAVGVHPPAQQVAVLQEQWMTSWCEGSTLGHTIMRCWQFCLENEQILPQLDLTSF